MNVVLARWVSLLWGLVLLASSCLSQATTYQDWWSNPQLSGMGLNIGQQGKNIFVTWFMYDGKGDPSFLLFFGDLNDSQSLTAELRRYYGPEPSGYDESLWYSEVVGTATISFSGVAAGTFSYQYGGMSGSFPIQRYTFRNINLSGTYDGLTAGTDSNCGANNGTWVATEVDSITHNGNDFALTLTDEESNVYNIQMDLTQHGTHFTGSGSFSGPNTGTFSVTDMQLVDGSLVFNYVAIDPSGCRSDGTTVAIRRAF